MKKLFLIVMALCFGVSTIFAQTKQITGKITAAEDGVPIPGVTVSVKGTTTGTITNVSGEYSLRVINSAEILIFSFVGMKTQEIPISSSIINVVLEPDIIGVDEVLVVAYGTS